VQQVVVTKLNLFGCRTDAARRLSTALGALALAAWLAWISKETSGYSDIKPLGWAVVFGAPLLAGLATRFSISNVRDSARDVRVLISICLLWLFGAAAWGFIWRWESEFSSEQYVGLLVLPPTGFVLAFLLWRWSRAS
jgi:hypothetical protein